MNQAFSILLTSEERSKHVIADVTAGSEPRLAFYVMLLTATLIACIGLIADSTAVVIGAMLVSPLMSPIFGIALGILRSDGQLLGRALRAEIVGVVLAVSVACLFGMLPLEFAVTQEMVSRTQPNLLDLLVAVLAGLAGAYAMVDERISPALPGVAIATAIVPPLANTGLCLAIGAYAWALGSMLLFVANFVSILVVGSIIFALAGMGPRVRWRPFSSAHRRFGIAFAGFLLITAVLTNALIRITQERKLVQRIRIALDNEFGKRHGVTVEEFLHRKVHDRLSLLVTVRSPRLIKPQQVAELEDDIARSLELPEKVDLVVRSILAKDVSAPRKRLLADNRTVGGKLLRTDLSLEDIAIQAAEQLLLEKFSSVAGFELVDIEYGEREGDPVVMASCNSLHVFERSRIAAIQTELRQRLMREGIDKPNLELIIQFHIPNISTSLGRYNFDWTKYGDENGNMSPNDVERIREIENVLFVATESLDGVYPVDAHFRRMVDGDGWRVLLEVQGPRTPTPEEVRTLETLVSDGSDSLVEVNVWHVATTVVTSAGSEGYSKFVHPTRRANIKNIERRIGK